MILSKDFKILSKIKTENPTENNLMLKHKDGRRSAPQNLFENLTDNLFENQLQNFELVFF